MTALLQIPGATITFDHVRQRSTVFERPSLEIA